MGIAIIVCLSYNMLLGQGGMLSFGHAVYSGWAPSWRSTRSTWWPRALPAAGEPDPDGGRAAGWFFAVLFG